jgi:hypothetical protein
MGHSSTIRGIRRSSQFTTPVERRATLQQHAAATQGKGDAPWVLRRRGPRVLPHDLTDPRPVRLLSAPLRRVGLSGQAASGSLLTLSIGQSVN